jgi:hypothetical protein
MIKIKKGRQTRYARKVDVFFSVTTVTRVTQTVNVGKNRQENASSPTHSTEKKKNHSHDRQKRIRSGSFYV